MVNVRNVAAWFLSHSSMTHKKLQKLCYYAQAWYCALYDGTPLFSEEIQAWVHGPVIPALYSVYANYKWEEIPQASFDDSVFDEKTVDILNAVYDTYGGFTGDQLENLTHSEKPWLDVREGLKPWETCVASIPCSSMREYYAKQYEKSQND